MTGREALYEYRLNQAEITLDDAKKMLLAKISPRSVINRAYYAMFYILLALFMKVNLNIKTSKHTGVISIFDKEFVLSGKIDRKYSKMLHMIFDDRQEYDYKELIEVSQNDAINAVDYADDFINEIKRFIDSAKLSGINS